MELRVQIWGRVFVVSLGYKTLWMGNMSFLNIIEEEYDYEKNVVYASLLFRS